MHLRRYYTVLAAAARADHMIAASDAVRGLRASVGGTALPGGFPHRGALAIADYLCLEDLGDITSSASRAALAEELTAAGLSPRQASDVAAAL